MEQLSKRCFIFKYTHRKSLLEPEVALLPEFCVRCNHSFEFVVVNFAGLIYYESWYKVYKAYILLCTCGVTRALNIELTKDLENESLILALRRFLAKCEKAELIISNNFSKWRC